MKYLFLSHSVLLRGFILCLILALISSLISCASRRNDGGGGMGSNPVVLASSALGQGGDDKYISCNLFADKTFRGHVYLESKPSPDESKQCIHLDIQKAPEALLKKDSKLFMQIYPISLDEEDEELLYGPALVFSAVKKEASLDDEEEVSLAEEEDPLADEAEEDSHLDDIGLLSEDIDLTNIGEDDTIHLLSENIDPAMLSEGELPKSDIPPEYEGPVSSQENMFGQSKVFDHIFVEVEMKSKPESFFEDYNLEICGIKEEWEALLLMVHFKEQGIKQGKEAKSTPVRASHFLVPPFLTNPWDFREKKGDELAAFHPLAHISEEAPESTYHKLPQELCHQEL